MLYLVQTITTQKNMITLCTVFQARLRIKVTGFTHTWRTVQLGVKYHSQKTFSKVLILHKTKKESSIGKEKTTIQLLKAKQDQDSFKYQIKTTNRGLSTLKIKN